MTWKLRDYALLRANWAPLDRAMESRPASRHLASILSADVVGYSRLMSTDEDAALQTLQSHRAVISSLVAEHDGRVFGTAGDCVIAEFGSAVQSVRAAGL